MARVPPELRRDRRPHGRDRADPRSARRRSGGRRRSGIADGRDLLFYLRPTDDDRIAIGGGGLRYGVRRPRRGTRAPRTIVGSPRSRLAACLWLFPQLEGVRFTHAWGGPIDQTPSFLPVLQDAGARQRSTPGSGSPVTGSRRRWSAGRILASLVLGDRRPVDLAAGGGSARSARRRPNRSATPRHAGGPGAGTGRSPRRRGAPRGWLDPTRGWGADAPTRPVGGSRSTRRRTGRPAQ